jgi:hypothetical protein
MHVLDGIVPQRDDLGKAALPPLRIQNIDIAIY